MRIRCGITAGQPTPSGRVYDLPTLTRIAELSNEAAALHSSEMLPVTYGECRPLTVPYDHPDVCGFAYGFVVEGDRIVCTTRMHTGSVGGFFDEMQELWHAPWNLMPSMRGSTDESGRVTSVDLVTHYTVVPERQHTVSHAVAMGYKR